MQTKHNQTADSSQSSKAPYSTPQDPSEGKKDSSESRTPETALGLNNYSPMNFKSSK